MAHGVEAVHGGDIEHAVGGGGGRADGLAQVYSAEDFLLLARGEHVIGSVAGAEIDFAVGDQRRGPGFAFDLDRKSVV